MKGTLKLIDNKWHVTQKTTEEGDDVTINTYPLSAHSVYRGGFGLKEGKNISFELNYEVYYSDDEKHVIKEAEVINNITRVEVINKISGREYVVKSEDIEVQYQDNGKTLKVFY